MASGLLRRISRRDRFFRAFRCSGSRCPQVISSSVTGTRSFHRRSLVPKVRG